MQEIQKRRAPCIGDNVALFIHLEFMSHYAELFPPQKLQYPRNETKGRELEKQGEGNKDSNNGDDKAQAGSRLHVHKGAYCLWRGIFFGSVVSFFRSVIMLHTLSGGEGEQQY